MMGAWSVAVGLLAVAAMAAKAVTVDETTDVAPVWSSHPVGFSLLTRGKRQFVAFYDAERRMTLGERELGSKDWRFVHLPETLGWDSHNYVTMTADDEGCLHVSGNMHVKPLVYFRSTRPWDIESLERVPSMVGSDEQHCTYPQFLRGPGGILLFTYRDGRSGAGNQIWDAYDTKSRAWRRLMDKPLTDGHGRMNAYFNGPVLGPDGWFHLCWVWRDTPDCSTNHDLSYARSRDMVHWETGAGKPLTLPITVETADIVDHVPPGGGIINGNTILGFDSQKRPVIAYHKYDAAGNTQVFDARLENGVWRTYQVSDWPFRWDFKGGGTIIFEVHLGAVKPEPDGRLSQTFRTVKLGDGGWLLDEATMKPIGPAPKQASLPTAITQVEGSFPGLTVRTTGDSGSSGERGVRYLLRWEALPENRDHPRTGPLPPPSMLRVYRVRE